MFTRSVVQTQQAERDVEGGGEIREERSRKEQTGREVPNPMTDGYSSGN